MVSACTAQHDKGSPPEAVAHTVTHALTTARPQAHHLTGRNSRQMALIKVLTPVRDAIRRRITNQPALRAPADGPVAADHSIHSRGSGRSARNQTSIPEHAHRSATARRL